MRLSIKSVLVVLSTTTAAYSEDVSFDPGFFDHVVSEELKKNSKLVSIPEGKNELALFLNGKFIDDQIVTINKDSEACVDNEIFKKLNLRVDNDDVMVNTGECIDLRTIWSEANVKVNVPELRLEITVPQAALSEEENQGDFAQLKDWSDGEPGLGINYNASYNRNEFSGYDKKDSSTNIGLGLDSSLHTGFHGIEVLTSMFINRADSSNIETNVYNGFLRAPVPKFKSTFSAGQTSTPGDVFDSVPMFGAVLKNDDSMLPDSARNYAPKIKGIAKTNARVQIFQKGSLLREVYVTPGPFEINDVASSNFSSDLTVKVIEANGETSSFILPYSSTINNLRDGSYNYSISSGKLNGYIKSYNKRIDVKFLESTVGYGLSNLMTVYGGVQLATNNFQALSLGNALSTTFGAFSMDGTFSSAKSVNDGISRGGSLRLQYSKNLEDTGSSFNIITSRYSSKGYSTLSDSVNSDFYSYTRGAKLRMDANINQNIGSLGNISVLYGRSTYWKQGTKDYAQISFSSSLKSINYNIGYSKSLTSQGGDAIYMSLNIPFGSPESNYHNISVNASRDENSNNSLLSGVNGTIGTKSDYNYNINIDPVNNKSLYSSLMKAHQYGNSAISLGYDRDNNKNLTLTSAGGVVLHNGGVNFSPVLSDTFAIIQAEDMKDVHLAGHNTSFASNGYAVIPQLNPYHWNEIILSDEDNDNSGFILNGSKRVAPFRGTMSKLVFKAEKNKYAYLQLISSEGKTVPFGARVSSDSGFDLGFVGESGYAYIRYSDIKAINVSWNEKDKEYQCHAILKNDMNTEHVNITICKA